MTSKAPQTTFLGSELCFEFYLVFNGTDGTMKMSRRAPSITRHERVMSMRARLPRALFQTPQLEATITIGEAVPSRTQIDVAAAASALKKALGVDIDLQVIGD